MYKFIIADSIAVYGLGNTAEEAHQDARQFASNLPDLADLPMREQANGAMYIGRVSAALAVAIDKNPQVARCRRADGVEYTVAEDEAIDRN